MKEVGIYIGKPFQCNEFSDDKTTVLVCYNVKFVNIYVGEYLRGSKPFNNVMWRC